MDKNARPRTKRLERPTPNLTHPVISTKKLNGNELQLGQSINSLNKCQISCSTQVSNKLKVNTTSSMSSLTSLSSKSSSDKTRQTISKQKISDFKSNSNQLNDSIKLSIVETNSDIKCEPIPKERSQQSIASKTVQTNHSLNEVKDNETIDNDKHLLNIEKEESDWSGWHQFNAQLIPCSHCCRTFFPHRLHVHEKCCKGVAVKKVNHRSKPSFRTTPIKCVSLECTSCGRKYRTTSLTSHQIKCKTFNNYHKKRVNTEKIETQIKSISEYRLKSRLRDKSVKSLSDKFQEITLKSKESILEKE